MKKIFLTLLAVFAVALFSSCYEPSPLYGTWQDQAGNKISFVNDGTYSAKIFNTKTGASLTYQGNYTVMENVLIFGTDSGNITTEWDIRGNILYCTWGANQLSLYHVSK